MFKDFFSALDRGRGRGPSLLGRGRSDLHGVPAELVLWGVADRERSPEDGYAQPLRSCACKKKKPAKNCFLVGPVLCVYEARLVLPLAFASLAFLAFVLADFAVDAEAGGKGYDDSDDDVCYCRGVVPFYS